MMVPRLFLERERGDHAQRGAVGVVGQAEGRAFFDPVDAIGRDLHARASQAFPSAGRMPETGRVSDESTRRDRPEDRTGDIS